MPDGSTSINTSVDGESLRMHRPVSWGYNVNAY